MKITVKESTKKVITYKKLDKKIKELLAEEIGIAPTQIGAYSFTDKGIEVESKISVNHINISPEELINKNIKQILKDKGYDYRKVEVEISEPGK